MHTNPHTSKPKSPVPAASGKVIMKYFERPLKWYQIKIKTSLALKINAVLR